MNVSLLAAETLHKDIWYPTILGILVVVFAIGLFCGSLYLLLATNMGRGSASSSRSPASWASWSC